MTAVRQIPLPIGPLPAHSFEAFLPGANGAALAHLRALAASLPRAAASPALPLYLWGAAGCGKTHLLQALGDAVQRRGHRVGWFDASTRLPWRFDEGWSLLLIDACERLDEARQHAAFTLFIEAQAESLALGAAGTLPPVDLPLREDLRTRLGWGHVFAIEPLGEPDIRAALRREADRRGILLGDEVMSYLLTRFSRDLKHLMALLDRLDEFALSQQRAITVPLLKRLFDEEGATL